MSTLTLTLERSTWHRLAELASEDTIRAGLDLKSRFQDRRQAAIVRHAQAERRERELYDALGEAVKA